MKAPDEILVHKRADLWLIRDPFFICIANSFFKEQAKCYMQKDREQKRKFLFLFLLTMWHNRLVLPDLNQKPFLFPLEYKQHEVSPQHGILLNSLPSNTKASPSPRNFAATSSKGCVPYGVHLLRFPSCSFCLRLPFLLLSWQSQTHPLHKPIRRHLAHSNGSMSASRN